MNAPADNLGFAAGTRFRSPLVLANIGDSASVATISVDFHLRGKSQVRHLAPIRIESGELKTVDLATAFADLPESLQTAGLSIGYTGSPGTIIGQLTSIDSTSSYAADTPIRDPLSGSHRVSGSYPFRLDGGYRAVLHLKNYTQRKRAAMLVISYEGGQFKPEQYILDPDETISIDVEKLRDDQTPDAEGRRLPSNLANGKFKWYEVEPDTIIGRAELVNIRNGTSSSFSCGGVCSCAPWTTSYWVNPGASAWNASATFGYLANESRATCGTQTFPTYNMSSLAFWNSVNSGVAQSQGVGSYLGAGSGATNIGASWTVSQFVSYDECPRQVSAQPSAQAKVKPRLDSVSPSYVIRGTQTTLTLSGSGFGTSPSVSTDDASGLTIQSHSDTQVVVSLTVGGSLGDKGITITSAGQVSDKKFEHLRASH